ncbi:MAG: hypothetical protein WCV92_02645 [Candidatus Buchananbacteria bacterium]
MDSLINKLSQLPLPVKQKLSSPEFLSVFNELDQRYNVKSAIAFLDYAMGFVSEADLPIYLSNKFNVNNIAAKYLANQFAVLRNKLPELETVEVQSQKGRVSGQIQDDKEKKVSDPTYPKLQSGVQNDKEEVVTGGNLAKGLTFDAEDEEEINIYKQKVENYPSKDYNFDSLSDIIIKESGAKIKDEVILKRLKNLIILYLKDIRDEMETMDALTKSQKIGGMEFDPAVAKNLIQKIKENKLNDNSTSDPGPKIFFPQAVTKQKIYKFGGCPC